VGQVPLEWYTHEEHVGYDVDGQKLARRPKRDLLDKLVRSQDAIAKVGGAWDGGRQAGRWRPWHSATGCARGPLHGQAAEPSAGSLSGRRCRRGCRLFAGALVCRLPRLTSHRHASV
jgi:hypothetical protein